MKFTSDADHNTIFSLVGERGARFLGHAADSLERLLPHASCSSWSAGTVGDSKASWTGGSDRQAIKVTISIGRRRTGVTATVTRRQVPRPSVIGRRTLDNREHRICALVAQRAGEILRPTTGAPGAERSLDAIEAAFDEQVVAAYIKESNALAIEVDAVLRSMHELAEQTYENKAISFGCLIDPSHSGDPNRAIFPARLLEKKRYRALSDGFRTAYHVLGDGVLWEFVDLEDTFPGTGSARHFFPIWSEYLARASTAGRIGVALTKHGDILVFEEGSLRFSYRYGKWQYWHHAHLRDLIRKSHSRPEGQQGYYRKASNRSI